MGTGHTSVIPAIGKQEGYNFKTSLGYTARPCLKKIKRIKKRVVISTKLESLTEGLKDRLQKVPKGTK